MNFKELTGRTIKAAFEDFHERNPDVYKLFKQYVRELYDKGKRKMSSKLIINRIRWEIYMETDSDDCFRINDAYTAYYVRLFAEDFPAYKNLFNYRRIRS